MSNKPNLKKKKAGAPQQPSNIMDSQMMQDISPEMAKKLETGQAAITQMLYDPRTKDKVKQMLSNGEPQVTLPMTTNAVFAQFEGMSQRGPSGKMPIDVKLALGVHTFQELLEMGAGLGLLPKMDLQQAQPMLKDALQQYIQRGLKDKSIDPIELQNSVNPLLTEQEQQIGQKMGQEQGVPGELTQQQSTEGLMQQRMMPGEVKNQQLQKENQQMQGALKGVAAAPKEGM